MPIDAKGRRWIVRVLLTEIRVPNTDGVRVHNTDGVRAHNTDSVRVDNTDGALRPGMYADMRFHIERDNPAIDPRAR